MSTQFILSFAVVACFVATGGCERYPSETPSGGTRSQNSADQGGTSNDAPPPAPAPTHAPADGRPVTAELVSEPMSAGAPPAASGSDAAPPASLDEAAASLDAAIAAIHGLVQQALETQKSLLRARLSSDAVGQSEPKEVADDGQ